MPTHSKTEFALSFNVGNPKLQNLCKLVIAQLEAVGLTPLFIDEADGHRFYMVGCSAEIFEKEAADLEVKKPLNSQAGNENVGTSLWNCFTVPPMPQLREFTVADRLLFARIQAQPDSHFFSYAQRTQLLYSYLEHAPAGQYLANEMRPPAEPTDSLLSLCYKSGLLSEEEGIILPHDRKQLRNIWSKVKHSLCTPIDDIYAYYGEEIAMYFAWMRYLTLGLVPPAIAGIILWLCYTQKEGVNEGGETAIFALFVILWAQFFVKGWIREMQRMACRWGTLNDDADYNDHMDVRSEFHGDEVISIVTGEKTLHYPDWKRAFWYMWSLIVTAGMLLIAMSVMVKVCSFNLQGYMSDPKSRFHVPMFHRFSEPGMIFDPAGTFPLPLIPVVLHSIMIMMLNKCYSGVAKWLTGLENHRTVSQHNNSFILKRFCFEAFDCYLPLFYLAFVQLDVSLLAIELQALYTTDSLRRVLTESVIPFVLTKWSNRNHEKVKVEDRDLLKRSLRAIQRERNKSELEIFDDYLEMIVQFGYVTLFASAFPLASALSVFCNFVEVKSDAFKVSFVGKKPLPKRVSDIGIWTHLLAAMSWLAIFTNCMIFGFSSEQMEDWFPRLFKSVDISQVEKTFEAGNLHEAHDKVFKANKGHVVVGIVFGIEHVLVLVAVFISLSISFRPKEVTDELARQRFVIKQEQRAEAKKSSALLKSMQGLKATVWKGASQKQALESE